MARCSAGRSARAGTSTASSARRAHMLLVAHESGLGATACAIASLLEERDVFRRDAIHRDVDLRSRVALVAEGARHAEPDIDREAVRRVREQIRVWRDQLRVSGAEHIDASVTGQVLAYAY